MGRGTSYILTAENSSDLLTKYLLSDLNQKRKIRKINDSYPQDNDDG